jgi:hypothetical protein
MNARRWAPFLIAAARRDLHEPGERRWSLALKDVMEDDKLDAKRTGNEPAPILLLAIAVVPLIAIVAWLMGLFG